MAREWPPWDHTFWCFLGGQGVLGSLWNLSSPTKDWAGALGSESVESRWFLPSNDRSKTQWLEACETTVLAWAVPPPLSMGNLGHFPSPASDSSSTKKSWAKKSLRFYLTLWSKMPQAKDPFLIYHTPDHWVGSSDTVIWRWAFRSSKTNKGSCLDPGLCEVLATGDQVAM